MDLSIQTKYEISEKIDSAFDRLMKSIDEGYISASQGYVAVKEVERKCEVVRNSLKKSVSEEITARGTREGVEAFGQRVSEQQKRTWSFEHIYAWLSIKEKINDLTKELKSIESIAKTIKEPMTIEATGEIIEPAICTYGEPIIKVEEIK